MTILGEHARIRTSGGESDRWRFTAYGEPLHNNAVTYTWRQARERRGSRASDSTT